jgi:hypothetical protein
VSASYRNLEEFLFIANIGGREPYLPVKVTWNLCWITRMWKILLYPVGNTKYEIPAFGRQAKYGTNIECPMSNIELRKKHTIT